MGEGRTHPSGLRRIAQVLGLAVVAVIGVFTVEPTAHHDDAAQYWTMAGRLARTDDPFYVAAVDHKGPLWVGAYRLAWAITGEQAWFWFLMAAQVVLFAIVTAAGIRWLLQMMGAPARVADASAALLGLYLVFGPEGYSNLLYGRNITTALTAIGVGLAWRSAHPDAERPERSALSSGATALCGGVAFGLATQTVFTTALPLALVTLALVVLARGRRRIVLGGWIFGLGAALASVVIWYGAKGAAPELRTWLWDYNMAYGSNDAPLLDRTGRAVREVGVHLITRPFLLIAPAAIAALVRVTTAQRRAIAFAGAWWFGELAAVAAPDRWFDHYWILLAPPTACLGGLVASALVSNAGVGRGLRVATFGLAAVAGLYALPGVAVGASATIGFTGVDEHQVDRERAQPDEVAELRHVVAQHSQPDDPILVWASAAGPYVAVDRPAASRFDRRTWLTGEIFGSDQVAIVPGAWDALMDDLNASPPVLIVEYRRVPIAPDTPLHALMDRDYELIAETSLAHVHVRVDRRPEDTG